MIMYWLLGGLSPKQGPFGMRDSCSTRRKASEVQR